MTGLRVGMSFRLLPLLIGSKVGMAFHVVRPKGWLDFMLMVRVTPILLLPLQSPLKSG